MTNAIDDMINEAAAEAEKTTTDVAVADTGSTAVATGGPLDMESMVNQTQTLVINHYIKATQLGIQIGKEPKHITEELKGVIIDVSQAQMKMSIMNNNPVKYAHTFDQVTANDGRPWADVVREFEQLNSKNAPFPSADVVIRLQNDVESIKGEQIASEGEVLGRSLSKTEWREWAKFYKAVQEAGLVGQDVVVNMSFENCSYNGNDWSVLKFELVGPAEA